MTNIFLLVPARSPFIAGLALLCLFSGCRATPSPPVAPTLTPARASVDVRKRVRSLPLYHEAELACQHKQFAHAADLLQQLARAPGLSAEEIAFCQQQRTLCLQDAHLLPKTPPPSTPKPVSPIDADCGPRALAFVCQQLGVKTSLATLRQAAGTTGKGTTMAGLAKAAEELGLKAEGVQVSREALSEVETPAIAWINSNHYIALLSVQGSGEGATATVHDPNAPKEETIEQERLLRMSSGYLLLVHR